MAARHVGPLLLLQQAIAKAKTVGTGTVVVRNAGHFGAIGYYASPAEENQLEPAATPHLPHPRSLEVPPTGRHAWKHSSNVFTRPLLGRALALQAQMAAQAGCVGQIMLSSGGNMPPTFGAAPRLGTNPLAWATPAGCGNKRSHKRSCRHTDTAACTHEVRGGGVSHRLCGRPCNASGTRRRSCWTWRRRRSVGPNADQ